MRLNRTDSNDKDFLFLADLLNKELTAIYGDIQVEYEQYNRLGHIETVLVIYHNELPVACGCFKQYDAKTAEIKRMFVLNEHRRKGIAAQILNELEYWAKQAGFIQIILETGNRQPDSIALYTKAGYQQIANYEPYMEMVESVCYCKILQ